MSEMTIGIILAVLTFLIFGGLISHFAELPFFASGIGICLVFWLHYSFMAWDDEMPGVTIILTPRALFQETGKEAIN